MRNRDGVGIATLLPPKLRRWLPEIAALTAGAVAVRGLPPYQEEWAMILGLSLFLRLLAQTSCRQSAKLGFLFGLSHFSLGFSWVITSLHTYGNLPMVAALGMLLALAAIMAVYTALFGAVLFYLAPRPELLPLAAPAWWVVTEWLRTNLFTGFAWNLVGYGWNGRELIMQVADIGGVYLLSWMMVFIAAVLTTIWLRSFALKTMALGGGIIVALLVAATLYGHWRIQYLQQAQSQQPGLPPITVALIQGNIPQDQKWQQEFREVGIKRYLTLSHAIAQPVDLLVWPETAITFFLQTSPVYQQEIAKLSRHLGAPILTGAPMADKGTNGKWKYYNSLLLLDESGSLKKRYDKHHLVPFGEFIPFRAFVPTVFSKFTQGTEDFSEGKGAIPLAFRRGAIGPLICYEAIFPHEVQALAQAGARWLVNVTNDAWFGEAAKPQHLAMVRLRSVETRLPMIRVANTGISAVFDQFGHELGRLSSNQTGTLVVKVNSGVGKSWYQRSSQLWIWLALFLAGLSWLSGFLWPKWLENRKITHTPHS